MRQEEEEEERHRRCIMSPPARLPANRHRRRNVERQAPGEGGFTQELYDELSLFAAWQQEQQNRKAQQEETALLDELSLYAAWQEEREVFLETLALLKERRTRRAQQKKLEKRKRRVAANKNKMIANGNKIRCVLRG